MSSPRKKAISPAKRRALLVERLVDSMDMCAVARGEAQWTNGYRAAKGEAAEPHLYEKEKDWFREVGRRERRFRNLAKRALLEVSR